MCRHVPNTERGEGVTGQLVALAVEAGGRGGGEGLRKLVKPSRLQIIPEGESLKYKIKMGSLHSVAEWLFESKSVF